MVVAYCSTSSAMALTAPVAVPSTMPATAHTNPGPYAGGIMAVALPQGLQILGGLFVRGGHGRLLHLRALGGLCWPFGDFFRPKWQRAQKQRQEKNGEQRSRVC